MNKRKGPPGYPGDAAIRKQLGETVRKLRLEKGLSLEEADALMKEALRPRPHSRWPRALGIVTKKLRKSKSMSRIRLSRISGLPLRVINIVEHGKARDISLTQVVRLAMALEHSAEQFVELIVDCETKLHRK